MHRLQKLAATDDRVKDWLPKQRDITTLRKLSDLPAGARRYVERISAIVGLQVSVVSVGPDRAQTILD